jgi:hypothetical protein
MIILVYQHPSGVMMDDQKVELIFDENWDGGPVAYYMRDYSSKDFDTYVVREMSDSNRRALAEESTSFAGQVAEIFGRAAVKADFKYLRDSLIAERKANSDLSSSEQNDEFVGFGNKKPKFRPPAHNFSGPEFFDLARIAVAIGGSAVTVGLIKATKDIAVAWIKSRAGRKVTLKVGGNTIAIHGAVSEEQIDHAVEQLNKLAAVQPIKEKRAKVRTAQIEKAPLARAQGRKKRAAKKTPKQRQQS